MAYLYLEDGSVFEGKSFGYNSDYIGEIVFNTGMTGYQELLTDPSYEGQIVNMTYPLIGNYGVNSMDSESESPKVRGFIVRDYSDFPSNWMAEETLERYLKENKIVALEKIDTRALTRKIRNSGTMNALICQEKPTQEQLDKLKTYKVTYPVGKVTTKSAYVLPGEGLRVAVIDYGIKRNLLKSLMSMNYNIKVFPAHTNFEEIVAFKPNGIFLSNGPGDPKDNTFEIEQVAELMGKYPIFAVGLGHQILALANGGDTRKMKYGHRGSNHPVKDVNTGAVYITSQNHGYEVDFESIKNVGKVSFINLNDNTVAGIDYFDEMSFSVQFHPDSQPYPNEKVTLFSKFDSIMKANLRR